MRDQSDAKMRPVKSFIVRTIVVVIAILVLVSIGFGGLDPHWLLRDVGGRV